MKRLMMILILLMCAQVFAKAKPLSAMAEPYYKYVSSHVLVAFHPGTPSVDIERLVSQAGGKVGSYSELLDFYRVEVPGDVKDGVEFFRAQAAVKWANFNYIARMQYVPNDQYYSFQWHLPLIGLEQAWDITRGDASVTVAVLDQGFQFDHEDWVGIATRNPRDCISNDNNPEEPTLDDSHGMHTAGTIFARTDNTTGIAGIAPLCTLMPVRVLDNTGSGSSEAIANGFAWAAQHGADVVNASLGFPNEDNLPPQDPGQPLSGAVQQCADAGVIMAVSSGNDNADYVSYPAAYQACIAVGATALNNARAPYSNMGAALDVTAPGGNTDEDLNGDQYFDGVLSTLRTAQSGDYYGFWQGTSMAAPHVAGLAALVLSHGCPADQVREAIESTCLDLGSPGWDTQFGYGRINALAALQYDCSGGGGGGEVVLFNGLMDDNDEGWTVSEDGADGVGWRFLDFGAPDCGAEPHSGANGLWHDDEQSVGLLDDWLYSPEITIPASASIASLTFWERNCYVTPQYYDLHAVYYSTNGTTFTQLSEQDDQAETWEQVTLDISFLAGQDVYFAWRYRGDYATEWFLDDVRVTATVSTDVPRDSQPMAADIELGTAYPNPFNSTVQIPFEIGSARDISLAIFNVLGQEVATLIHHERLTPGSHRTMWSAEAAASGVYLVKLSSGEHTATQKILLVK
ncbi:MAG: S8 family peptidase [bacterium]|nr:S8 family peptidase [bacterium]